MEHSTLHNHTYTASSTGAVSHPNNIAVSRDGKTHNDPRRRSLTHQERREQRRHRLERKLLQALRRGLPALVLFALVFVICVQPIFAAGSTPFETVVNNIEQLLLGPVGRAVAVIGVVIAGIAIIIGENPRILVSVCLGIALIVGGAQLVTWLTS